jgi:hypothetical protein
LWLSLVGRLQSHDSSEVKVAALKSAGIYKHSSSSGSNKRKKRG